MRVSRRRVVKRDAGGEFGSTRRSTGRRPNDLGFGTSSGTGKSHEQREIVGWSAVQEMLGETAAARPREDRGSAGKEPESSPTPAIAWRPRTRAGTTAVVATTNTAAHPAATAETLLAATSNGRPAVAAADPRARAEVAPARAWVTRAPPERRAASSKRPSAAADAAPLSAAAAHSATSDSGAATHPITIAVPHSSHAKGRFPTRRSSRPASAGPASVPTVRAVPTSATLARPCNSWASGTARSNGPEPKTMTAAPAVVTTGRRTRRRRGRDHPTGPAPGAGA